MLSNRIAIVSTNRSKYSETFIQSHLKYISAYALYLFDGYFPLQYSIDKLKTTHKINPRKTLLSFSDSTKKNDDPQNLQQLLVDQNIEIVIAEYGPSGVEMASICQENKIPLLVHFHGYDAYRNDVLSSYGKQYKKMFELAAAIVGVSKDMVKQLIHLGCDPLKIHHIPYGVDTILFNLEPTTRPNRVFVSCGRFVAKKGPTHTIQAFSKVHKQFPDAQLIMIGDGELLESCKKLVQQLELSNVVQFRGALPQREIAKIFSVSSIFLQHSMIDENNDSEGTPLVIMEAGASGLPVISTLHGGIPDVIENGKDGYLVKAGDVDAMAEKMLLLLNDPNGSIKMGKHLQHKVMLDYSQERYISELQKLIQYIIKLK